VKQNSTLLIVLALALAGCAGDPPLPTASHMFHDGGVMLSDLARAGNAQTLAALRQFTTHRRDGLSLHARQ
jgi:hypothetical protein